MKNILQLQNRKTFNCDTCNKKFNRKDSFKNHLETTAHLLRKEGAKSHLVIQGIKENKNDGKSLLPNKHIKEEHQTLFNKQLLAKNNPLELKRNDTKHPIKTYQRRSEKENQQNISPEIQFIENISPTKGNSSQQNPIKT